MSVNDLAPISTSSPGAPPDTAAREAQRTQLAALAAEFESMLLMTMLRDMRTSGQWAADESGVDSLGADTFNQTFDVELSRFLSKAGGLGLSDQLLKAFEAMMPGAAKDAGTTGDIEVSPLGAPAVPLAPEASAVPTAIAALRAKAAYITSGFGWREDPLNGEMKFHRGIDIRAAEGDLVVSTAAGRVVFSGVNGGYGTSVVVEHANGLRTRYAHLSAALVGEGDQVTEGQAIGQAGQTGRATGPHLHYEVETADGQPVDPR